MLVKAFWTCATHPADDYFECTDVNDARRWLSVKMGEFRPDGGARWADDRLSVEGEWVWRDDSEGPEFLARARGEIRVYGEGESA
jgi:hypothetical protein